MDGHLVLGDFFVVERWVGLGTVPGCSAVSLAVPYSAEATNSGRPAMQSVLCRRELVARATTHKSRATQKTRARPSTYPRRANKLSSRFS